MVKSVTMVMRNKILSRGTKLVQTQSYEKGIQKRNSQMTILLTLSKLKGEFITQSNIKTKPFVKTINSFKPLTIFTKKATPDIQLGSEYASKIVKCKKQIKQT